MTTNREWLYSLDVADLADWFDAEHVEGIIVNNYVTKTPSNIRKGLGYKDRPPHEKSEECKRFERELDAELDEIDDSLAKQRDELITERDWLITGWSDALDGWTKAEKRNYELTAERDELKAFSGRLETAAHDKLGVTLFGVDYVTEEFMLHVRDTLTAERDGLKAQVNSWRERNGGNMAMVDSLAKQVNELRAERDELKEKLRIEREAVEVCDGCNLVDEWKRKAESALHENPYVGLVRGKQWERTETSDYYCGRCGWKVTDHDSYCPECGGALHGASNKPNSQFDVLKTAENAENVTSKNEIHNFDDSREQLEADVREWIDIATYKAFTPERMLEVMFHWLDRQAAITRATESHGWRMAASGPIYEYRQERDRLQAKLDEMEAECDALARDLAECDENRIEFRDQRDHAEKALDAMERERDYWKLHADCWADKYKDAEVERDAYHERAVELEIELAQANGNLKNTTHNHAAAKAKYERAQADAARARERQLEAERKYAELLEKPPEGAWAERIAVLEAGNEELRERLSEALGHAHEIGKLGDLEGRAAS